MPKWIKAPDALVDLFNRVTGDLAGVQIRKMFGYPAAFVSGQMFSGLFQSSMILRLSEQDRALFLDKHGARLFEPMPGRVMREYVVVPETLLRSEDGLASWLMKGLGYVKALPPKSARPRKPSPRKRAR